ncbi:hypothetical protein EOM86_00730 [Candidatus Nomurabacteria bacterium]|nr:hypothetical protein [Candidatus Nomurabacteria bacterium]
MKFSGFKRGCDTERTRKEFSSAFRLTAMIITVIMLTSLIASCNKPTNTPVTSGTVSEAVSDIVSEQDSEAVSAEQSSEEFSSDENQSGSEADSGEQSQGSGSLASIETSSATSSMQPPPSRFKDLKGREIKLFIWGYSEAYSNTPNFQPFKKRMADIEEKFNCKFTIVAGPTETDFNPIWQSILAGDPIVDIVDTAGPHTLANPIKAGLYMDLNQFSVFDWRLPKWDKQFLSTTNFGGKQYVCGTVLEGPTKGLLNQVIIFNKRLVQEAGYNPNDLYKWQSQGTWTWAKFLEIADKISDLDPGNTWGTAGNDKLLYADLCVSNNTNYIIKTTKGIEFNAGEAKALEALAFYKELYQKGVMPETDSFSDAQLFLAGKVGFLPEYMERLQYPETYGAMVDDYGLLMFPKGPKATDYISAVDWFGGNAIPTGTENAQDIALVIDYMTDSTYASAAEANRAMVTARETYVRDEQSLVVFDMIETRTIISPTWLGEPVRGDWLSRLDAIKKGEITAADAVAQNKDNYAVTLKDVWDIK